MKKLLLLICAFTIGTYAMAQQFVSGSHIKMSDAIANYQKNIRPYRSNDAEEAEQSVKGFKNSSFKEHMEGKDYLFDRWKWYWQQHMDANGYLVSPAKTFNSWMEYKRTMSTERTTASSGANWVFQGPDSSGANGSGVGRLNVVAFHPTDSNTYWVGSPGGGAWKTTNNGTTWTCMTDQLPLLSMTDIVFNPKNANTIYLCTGDRDGFDYYSVGILKSYDGGTTWNTTGIRWSESQFHEANSLLINPLDTNSLIFASDSAIYRSFNGGTTWRVVKTGIFMQLLYHPTDTNIVYATTQFNYNTSTQSQIYRSADGGMTWNVVTTFTDAERIALAVTPANVSIVEAVVAASQTDPSGNTDGLQGIWKSTDTGHTFTQVFNPGTCGGTNRNNLLSGSQRGSGCGGQGWYDLCIAISPSNANNVYVGGTNAWKSTNGGTSWTLMNQWSGGVAATAIVHGDKHFMGFNPLTPTRFFECNDGGIYYSYNPSAASSWVNKSNHLGIEEIYRVAVSNVATYQFAGAQDVGTKQVQNFTYFDVDGGDGMECQLDPVDSNTGYASIYYGYIDLLNLAGISNISANIPGTPSGAWVTPFIIEPSCSNCLLAGYQDVYRSPDQGTTWTDISGALIGANKNLYRVVTTLADSNTIYATLENTDSIFYTHTMGSPWSTIAAPYSGQQISDVLIDPKNANNLWFAFSGYTSFGSPQVVTYNATTSTWASFNTGLPDVPINCITIDTQNRTLYVGTEVGVFYRDSTMTSWSAFSTGMPVVMVTDLQFDYATNKIWASTYGRSLWASVRHIPPASTGIANTQTTNKGFTVQPNPNHGNFTIIIGNTTDKQVTMTITDNLGNVVWHGTGDAATQPIKVNTTGLAAGNYILEVSGTNSGVIGREKIVIY